MLNSDDMFARTFIVFFSGNFQRWNIRMLVIIIVNLCLLDYYCKSTVVISQYLAIISLLPRAHWLGIYQGLG